MFKIHLTCIVEGVLCDDFLNKTEQNKTKPKPNKQKTNIDKILSNTMFSIEIG